MDLTWTRPPLPLSRRGKENLEKKEKKKKEKNKEKKAEYEKIMRKGRGKEVGKEN